MWYIPSLSDALQKFPDAIKIDVFANPDGEYACCKYNVENTIRTFGGVSVEGSYILFHETLNIAQLISHYIWKDCDGTHWDVTPFRDNRLTNIFVKIPVLYNKFVRFPEYHYSGDIQETEILYYVYCYINPETKQPMYVGKGEQDRASLKLCSIPSYRKKNDRFLNKLNLLKEQGITPDIMFLAQNIDDEQTAYEIEEEYIKKYGRIGYTENGILLNICESSRPPNHKGKTYEQIYGTNENATAQIEKRRAMQLEAGGYGPKKHSDETKRKIGEKPRIRNIGSHLSEDVIGGRKKAVF